MPDSRSTSSRRALEPVAALIMAAGGSSRMGISKPLLDWRGESLVLRAVRAALASGCARVFVVVGRDGARIATELRDTEAEVIVHREWSSGMGSSIAAGIAHIEAHEKPAGGGWRGVVLLLCDQPFIESDLIDRLCAGGFESERRMAACRFGQTLGPPAYFDRSLFAELSALKGDRGAKGLLLADPADVTEVDCPAAAIDLDTPEDYQRALAMAASELE